jgi:hypothetical protein
MPEKNELEKIERENRARLLEALAEELIRDLPDEDDPPPRRYH